jgi:hypothetical protein
MIKEQSRDRYRYRDRDSGLERVEIGTWGVSVREERGREGVRVGF